MVGRRTIDADHGVSREGRHAEDTVAQAATEKTMPLMNVYRGGGGSHRRSRPAERSSSMYVATKTFSTPAPSRVRLTAGKVRLPHTRWLPLEKLSVNQTRPTPPAWCAGFLASVAPQRRYLHGESTWTELASGWPHVLMEPLTMETHNGGHDAAPQGTLSSATVRGCGHPIGTCNGVTGADPAGLGDAPSVTPLPGSARTDADGKRRRAGSKVPRGLTTTVSPAYLQRSIWLRALLIANRFRVIRTLDIAVCCFPERTGFKASLTAAQRAVRGLVKAGLLRRYRTDRFQTIYGLAQAGADYIEEAGFDAASSVRRVSDMTNPEHRLWAQFLVLASEARGLQAMTEQELLQHLNKDKQPGDALVQGLLRVTWTRGKTTVNQQLRPDAVAIEPDGTTWLEVDRSKRSANRFSALEALVGAVGRKLTDGNILRRVVIFCKSERIRKGALALLHGLANENNSEVLTPDRRHFREVEPGIFEVWSARTSKLLDGRTKLVDSLAGHVIVQLLPIWLPRVRIDSKNTFSMAGWFGENYLPYRRPASMPPWQNMSSPLLPQVSTRLGQPGGMPPLPAAASTLRI